MGNCVICKNGQVIMRRDNTDLALNGDLTYARTMNSFKRNSSHSIFHHKATTSNEKISLLNKSLRHNRTKVKTFLKIPTILSNVSRTQVDTTTEQILFTCTTLKPLITLEFHRNNNNNLRIKTIKTIKTFYGNHEFKREESCCTENKENSNCHNGTNNITSVGNSNSNNNNINNQKQGVQNLLSLSQCENEEQFQQLDEDKFEQQNIEVTNEQEDFLIRKLSNHYLFKHFEPQIIQILLDNAQGYQIEQGVTIYEQGKLGEGFFIIQSGCVKITIPENQSTIITSSSSLPIQTKERILGPGECFGDLALIYSGHKRRETAVAITPLDFYVILGYTYRETTKNFCKHSIEQLTNYINRNIWLVHLDPAVKLILASLTVLEEYEPNEFIYSSSDLMDLNKIYLVNSGHLNIVKKNNSDNEIIEKIYPNHSFGELQMLLGIELGSIYELKGGNSISSAYVLTKDMLSEAIGPNYQETILFSIFSFAVKHNEFLNNIFLETYYKEIFYLFQIQQYEQDKILFSHKSITDDNKKLYLILSGSLIDSNTNQIVSKPGKIYGDELINQISTPSSQCKKNSSIIVKESLITLECTWNKIKSKLKDLSKDASIDIFKRANRIRRLYLFKHISENKILELCHLMKKVKYTSGDVIIKQDTMVNNFFVISKGSVCILKNNTFIREVGTGNCFGEVSLLNEEPSDVSVIANASEVHCYTLTMQVFLKFLINEKMNNYIKKKMCLEDTNIELKDLFFIKTLGKGRFGLVSLVHNQISSYAIKTIPRSYIASNLQLAGYMIDEKNILLSLDHPYIVKLVKTLKNDNMCFFLMENVDGTNIDDYIGRNINNKYNLQYTKFFAASIGLVISYLSKKLIIHRDLKPSNIMIDNFGYFKIIDFGAAKKIKDFAFTIIGTPKCMAPEIILGKGYSYPIDYWSLGVCVYYFYYGKFPFGDDKDNVMKIYDEILTKEVSFPKEKEVFELSVFIRGLLNKNAVCRICTLERMQSEILFKGFNWEELKEFKMKTPKCCGNVKVVNDQQERQEQMMLQNLRIPFLKFISENKFEPFCPVQTNEAFSNSHRSLMNWFDNF